MFVPADLMLNATRSLATSALPNAPVEPDLPPRPSRIRTVLRALLNRGDGQRGDRDQAHRPGDTRSEPLGSVVMEPRAPRRAGV